MKQALDMHDNQLVQAMDVLGDPTRFMMFKLVCEGHGYCVTELANTLKVTPSAVSQHFHNFELLGLMRRARNGQKICYEVTDNDLTNKLRELVKE